MSILQLGKPRLSYIPVIPSEAELPLFRRFYAVEGTCGPLFQDDRQVLKAVSSRYNVMMDCVSSIRLHHALEFRRGEFLMSTDRSRLNLDVIHGFLTTCYWAKGIPREVVARSIENSLCFGIYHETGATLCQVGFARVISDFATIAYLGDVFVLEPYRGRGLSKWMMDCVMQHPQLRGLRRWILLTRDAHGLYSNFGFTPLKAPERYMELHNAHVYTEAT